MIHLPEAHLPVIATEAAAVSAVPLSLALATSMEQAIDVIPFSAGLTGAILSALMIQTQATTSGTGPGVKLDVWRRLTTAIAGVGAATWMAPAIADGVGWHQVRAVCLMHFIVGLLGYTIVAYVLANPVLIGRFFAKLVGVSVSDPNLKPPAMPVTTPKDLT